MTPASAAAYRGSSPDRGGRLGVDRRDVVLGGLTDSISPCSLLKVAAFSRFSREGAAQVGGSGLLGGPHEDQVADLSLRLGRLDLELRADDLRSRVDVVLDEADGGVLGLRPGLDDVGVLLGERDDTRPRS